MARLTLRLEATQTQAAHSPASGLGDHTTESANEDAETDTQQQQQQQHSPSHDPALSDSAELHSPSHKLVHEAEAASYDGHTFETTAAACEQDVTSQHLAVDTESDLDEAELRPRIKRRRLVKELDATTTHSDGLRPGHLEYESHLTGAHLLTGQEMETKPDHTLTPPTIFKEEPLYQPSSAQGGEEVNASPLTPVKHEASPSPSPELTPNSARLAAQQERAKKQYLREAVALRDEFGFAAVAQIIPFLRDGDLSAGRKRLQGLVEGYTIKYGLKHGDVLNAIRQGGGRLDLAEEIMEARQL